MVKAFSIAELITQHLIKHSIWCLLGEIKGFIETKTIMLFIIYKSE